MHKCQDVVVGDYRTEKLWSLLANRSALPPPLALDRQTEGCLCGSKPRTGTHLCDTLEGLETP